MSKMNAPEFYKMVHDQAVIKIRLTGTNPRDMGKGYEGSMDLGSLTDCYITDAKFLVKNEDAYLEFFDHKALQRNNIHEVNLIYDVRMEAMAVKITDNTGKEVYISTLTSDRSEDLVMLGWFFSVEKSQLLVVAMVGTSQCVPVMAVYTMDSFEQTCLHDFIDTMMVKFTKLTAIINESLVGRHL